MGTAVILLNAILLLVVVNVAAAALLALDDDEDGPRAYDRAWLIEAYGLETLSRNYPGWSRADLSAFLHETSNWVQQHEPFTGFRPVPRRDRFITIAPEGFRPVPRQAAWPPPAAGSTIFLFGGSTMMGAGVPDGGTIAAHLQHALASCPAPVQIYNFGRGFYFSTQERILFEQLLLEGHRPHAAIFLDGLNDFYFADGVPQYTSEFGAFMRQQSGLPDARPFGGALADSARSLPVVRAAERVGLVRRPDPALFGAPPPSRTGTDAERIDAVLSRWTRNREMIRSIAAANRVRVGFVWQPVPTYGYDVSHLTVYRPGGDLFGAHALSSKGYEAAAERHRRAALGADVLWLGDMQRNRTENLYVDAVHYTDAFSADIAERLAEFVRSHALMSCAPGREVS